MALAGTEQIPGGDGMTPSEMNLALQHYEGLVVRTAQLLVSGQHPALGGVGRVEMEEDDIRQELRIKVHTAILEFKPEQWKKIQQTGQRYGSTTPLDKARDGWVNFCVQNRVKDIAKRKKRSELYIEDIAPSGDDAQRGQGPRDKFDQRYLSVDAEEAFAEVEDTFPALPNTLTTRELQVVKLMCRSYKQTEISDILDLTKREVESAVRGVRVKLADWKPTMPDRDPASSTRERAALFGRQ